MVLKHGKKGAASSARPEETLKQWEARKAAVHRRQVMSKSAAVKAAGAAADAKRKAQIRKVNRTTRPKL